MPLRHALTDDFAAGKSVAVSGMMQRRAGSCVVSGMRGLTLVLLGLCAGTAAARPPPEPEEESTNRPSIEWSTWFRLGFGYAVAQPPASLPRMVEAPVRAPGTAWAVGLGAEASVGIANGGDVRFGLWGELRGTELFGGGQLVVTGVPEKLDMFLYNGEGVLMLRAGGNPDRGSAAIAYCYLAPWKLWGPWTGPTRYMIGVRFVATYTRAWENPRDWSATFGIEAEPVGALRYLLGIRSWY